MNRGNDSIPASENLVRKDVWRLRPSGSVKFQVRFGEYGGAYVNHCHNTVHEDFAMLLRYQILTDRDNPKSSNVHVDIIPTPIPTPDGCTYMTPDVLVEGNPLGNAVMVSQNNGGSSIDIAPGSAPRSGSSGGSGSGSGKSGKKKS
jgi:hypothetical protein